ncbi:hypothetical protein PB2503_06517 [Parvularcula bermudensis HTCC2503]|uniref:Metanogen output domain-containing protein n=1 Tax=Parvularcula bermudensis (strain ATCC BAA-594 / HTCC2503 / KCTC 12087) TaxID=314260 RepID=E0TI30_PARBH|nr:methanogen output domain 1-containing protein [Parvularcula bermudensis]ADM09369.1 hypothetical protein PB2503_06517 [Parvularcula bermudensis HTCC2503]
MTALPDVSDIPLVKGRDRDQFLRELLRELSGVLEDTVGLEAAEGFVTLVGTRMAERMNDEYLKAFNVKKMNARQVAEALVDLKQNIQGGFHIEHLDEDKMILVNSRCPFSAQVVNRPSLCAMTMNVFGSISAKNLGYSRLELPETIASGAPSCRVIIHFQEGEGGREFFG